PLLNSLAPPPSTLFPYTTLFRSAVASEIQQVGRVPRGAQLLSRLAPAARVVEPAVQRQHGGARRGGLVGVVHQLGAVGRGERGQDRKSTRLNSSHLGISYAVFCL